MLPDSDRWALTAGYGYEGATWTVDAYYMALFFGDRSANGSASEGVIDGEYSSFAHLVGVTLDVRF